MLKNISWIGHLMAYSRSVVFCTEVTQVIAVFALTHLPEARDN